MKFDFVIIGAGIVGLSVARSLRAAQPDSKILILDKELETAYHASGRNSGVLHAGFYYTADSMKARFTVAGSRAMKQYCQEKNLPLNACGKLVVAQNEEELAQLDELERRGRRNGSNIRLIDAAEAKSLEPNVKTHKRALYSPDTASIDPVAVCHAIKDDLKRTSVEFKFDTRYLGQKKGAVLTNQGNFEARHIVNCAGLYADQVAQDFGFGNNYVMIPFKGLYLKYTKNKTDVRMNIYPVPNLKNPFLGVHFTKTVDGSIKIGPTAIPAFWRENYTASSNFIAREMLEVVFYELRMLLSNASGFRNLAVEEIQKYNKKYFVELGKALVRDIDSNGFTEYTKPGIRAQLMDKRTLQLIQDFVVEGDTRSTHVLNAVSPAFTCAFPFAEFVVREHILTK